MFQPALAEHFGGLDVFTTSLLRSNEARVVLRDAGQLFKAQTPVERTKCSFLFEPQMKEAASPHTLSVTLGNESRLPDRMMALIGKNGTGKTWLLGRLAAALSGDERNVGSFDPPERPAFQRVIAMSYTVFDRFNRPTGNRNFGYVYCGIYDTEGKLLNRRQLLQKTRTAAAKVSESTRVALWKEMIAHALDKPTMESMRDYLFAAKSEFNAAKPPKLSSGQLVLISTITELVASIERESFVLIDEPEIHQHPNSVAGLLLAIHTVLRQFESFAIIATHSPLVIQQIPAQYVRVLIDG